MKWHVHVYETPRLAEVDVEAASEADALSQALALVQRGAAACDQPSPTAHMAVAFEVTAEEDPPLDAEEALEQMLCAAEAIARHDERCPTCKRPPVALTRDPVLGSPRPMRVLMCTCEKGHKWAARDRWTKEAP